MTTPTDVDITSALGPVRDQGARPTCLAFALSDAHAAARGAYVALSVEYLFYQARRRDFLFDPYRGATVPHIIDALRDDGQPTEQTWPYLDALPQDLRAYAPPMPMSSPVFRADSVTAALDTVAVRHALIAGRPVVLVLWLTEPFFQPPTNSPIHATPEAARVGLHAVTAVGYAEHQGEIAFRVKNSWGPTWADAGYAWIAGRYLQAHGVSTVEIM